MPTRIYDRTEADHFFACARTSSTPEQRESAACDLLDELAAVAQDHGYRAERHDLELLVRGGSVDRDVQVVYGDGEGFVCGWSGVDEDLALNLRFNAKLGWFEGLAPDDFSAPTPGSTRHRRSALAELAEVVVRLLEEGPDGSAAGGDPDAWLPPTGSD